MTKINNNIKEDYVSLELANLLKKKGFNVICNTGYSCEVFESNLPHKNSDNILLSAPTLEVAKKWIYDNFGLWVHCSMNTPYKNDWYFECVDEDGCIIAIEGYDSSSHAMESGLTFSLNLIH